MVTYTVHEHEDGSGGLAERADKIVFVKEGFALAALVFPIPWLLYHRMWFVLAGFIAVILALQAGIAVVDLTEPDQGLALLLRMLASHCMWKVSMETTIIM